MLYIQRSNEPDMFLNEISPLALPSSLQVLLLQECKHEFYVFTVCQLKRLQETTAMLVACAVLLAKC